MLGFRPTASGPLASGPVGDATPTVVPDWFFSPLSEPPARKIAQKQQALAWGAFTPAAFTEFAWILPWTDPVRIKPRVSDFPFLSTDTNPVVSFGWYGNLSEPKRFRPNIGAYNHLVWTGPINPTVSFGWFGSLTEPVRFKRFPASQNPELAWSTFTPAVAFTEFWYNPFSEPPSRRRAQQQQALAWGLFTPTPVTEFAWILPWTDPAKRFKFDTSRQPYESWSTFTPAPLQDFSWIPAWTDPVRRRPIAAFFSFWSGPINPTVSFGWYGALTEPVRQKRRLQPALNPFGVWDTKPTVSFGWYGRLTEPVREKKGFRSWLQQTLAFWPFPIQSPATVSSWFNWLTEPVRRTGYKWYLQRDLAQPDRVLPPPALSVTVVLDAIETNNDQAQISIEMRGAVVATCVVSIEEVPAIGDAAMSVREP